MKTSSLEAKTVRPGTGMYSFYYSNRSPVSRSVVAKSSDKPKSRSPFRVLVALIAILLIGMVVVPKIEALFNSSAKASKSATTSTQKSAKTSSSKTPATTSATTVATNQCAGNVDAHHVVVSISQRHMWACSGSTVAYDSPVVTGIAYLAADLTPTGNYTVYSKQTDLTLTGSDTTGSWNDPVSYWMPFLSNQYGTYGFHDATWRDNSDFGNISPNSSDASHGCVELPLATAKWLYDWAPVGTTVTINS